MIKRKVIDGVEYEAVQALAFELGITHGRCDGCKLDFTILDIPQAYCSAVSCYYDGVRYIWRKVDDDKGSSNDTTTT